MQESKSCALPTWLYPNMANLRGFEPLTHGLEGRCSIQLSYRSMERVKGVEPSQPAWKAGALPLSYTRKRILKYYIAKSNIFNKFILIKIKTYESRKLIMERMTRFELATLALARRCSTTEPFAHKICSRGDLNPYPETRTRSLV